MSFHFNAFQRMALSQLWQLTVVILVVGLLAHFLCRRRPHVAYVLWFVVLLKCVTPPIWSSPTGIFSWTDKSVAKHNPVQASEPTTSEPDQAETAKSGATGDSPVPGQDAHGTVTQPGNHRRTELAPEDFSESAAGAAEPVSAETVGPLRTSSVLGMVWLCGAAALAGLLVGRWSYYYILLRHARVETHESVARLVADLSRRLGLRRRVDVLVSRRPFGPAVYGVWRPTLILPQALVEEELTDHVRRIIAHELIHIRRGDHLAGMLQLLAQVIWWFHPLVWWTNRQMCVQREHCCDDEVVGSLNCDPGTYAQSLLDVLKLRRQLRPALLPGVDAPQVTKRRLENIMDRRKIFHRRMPRVCWAMLIVGILFVVPGAGFTFPGTGAEEGPTEKVVANDEQDVSAGANLQKLINRAKSRAVINVAPGTYTEPITINKPITLVGKDAKKCVLDVTADQPAIMVATRGPVTIDSLTIKWQRATSSGRPSGPTAALATKDSKATIRNCRVIAPSNPKRCPSAVDCMGFSNVSLKNCRFEGFEFCINYTGGADGKITDCVVLNPGHCGITVYSGSEIDVSKTIITGSHYHGMRCTGGKLLVHDNLIIDNRNRGIYLGNKPANGVIRNNVIMENGVGISAFPDAKVTIMNNLFLKSGYRGLDGRDSSQITVKNNIFLDNPKGFVLVREAGRNKAKLLKNTFWNNKTNTENTHLPQGSFVVDPDFKNLEQGDFTPQAKEITKNRQGLTNPKVFIALWKKWKALSEEE